MARDKSVLFHDQSWLLFPISVYLHKHFAQIHSGVCKLPYKVFPISAFTFVSSSPANYAKYFSSGVGDRFSPESV